jgi:hypothetical protein
MSLPRVRLARLSSPPNTSMLEPATTAEARRSIALLAARFQRRRALLAARGTTGAALERVLGAIRRLQSPYLQVFHETGALLASEPFDATPRVGALATMTRARELVARLTSRAPSAALVEALAPFGERALRLAAGAGVRVTVVPNGRPFTQCSPAVAALVPDIDRWQAPPAGLYVLEERLILLRSGALRMAAAHEFAHALDALLAAKPRSYFSFENPGVRSAYAAASGFLNEYAASGLDEYFAESLRAYVEVNDDRSSWLPLTRLELKARDPCMFEIIDSLFRSGRI